MQRSRRLLLWLAGIAVTGLLLLIVFYKAVTWNHPINQLKRSLSDRQSMRSKADWFGDYSEYIEGELKTGIEFEDVAAILELKKRTEGELPVKMLGWQHSPEEARWWRPPDRFDEIYYDDGDGGYEELLGRVGRRVYYQWLSW